MPTYEYACSACGHQWDEIQRITEPPRELCPKCGKSEAHRLISGGTNFILKGGGWYSDLYSSTKPNSTKTETSTPAASTTTSESTSDAKPAASTPSTPSSTSNSSTSN